MSARATCTMASASVWRVNSNSALGDRRRSAPRAHFPYVATRPARAAGNLRFPVQAMLGHGSSSQAIWHPPLNTPCKPGSLAKFDKAVRQHRRILARPAASSSAQASNSEPRSEEKAAEVSRIWTGRMVLLLVAATYGTLGVTFKTLYALPGPPSASVLSATRGLLTTLCFLPAMWHMFKRSRDQLAGGLWKAALILAVCNAGTMGLINVGLLHTEATRAAFLAQTSVCMTPLIQLLARERVPWTTWLGSGLCLAGVVMIGRSSSSVGSTIVVALNHGDLLCLGGAFCFAIYCVRVGLYSKRGLPTASLYACKNLLLAGVYISWVMVDTVRLTMSSAADIGWGAHLVSLWPGWNNPVAWGLLAFSAIVPGALADFLQAKGQESIPASEANIILCTDPLWAALFATIWLRESLPLAAWCGGALIVSASLTATLGTSEVLH